MVLWKIFAYINKLELIIPLNMVTWMILFGSINMYCTVISVIFSSLLGWVIYKYFINSMPKVFLTYTIMSLISHYVIFEFVSAPYITVYSNENFTVNLLMIASIFFMYEVKLKALCLKEAIATTSKLENHVKYCSVCDIYTPVQSEHYFWIDSCVVPGNKKYYICGLISAFFCMLYTSNLILTSLCDPLELFSGYLLPKTCFEVYQPWQSSMSFVCGVYQTLFLLFLVWEFMTLCTCHRKLKKNSHIGFV